MKSGIVTSEADCGKWRFLVVIASFLIFVQLEIPVATFGVMYSRLLMDSKISSTSVAWIFNINQLALDSSALLADPLCTIFGWRKVTFLAGLIYSLAIGVSGFVENPLWLFITYSLFAGVSSGMIIAICSFIVPLYFTKRRGIAIGLMYTGLSVGDFVSPLIVYYLQQSYGERSALFVLGALLLNVCASSMVFHPVEWHKKLDRKSPQPDALHPPQKENQISELSLPSFIEEERLHIKILKISSKTDSLQNDAISLPNKKANFKSEFLKIIRALGYFFKSICKNIKMLRSFRVCILSFSSAMTIVGLVNFLMLIPFALENRNMSRQVTVWCLSTMGIISIVVRLLVTASTDVLPFSAKWYFMAGMITNSFSAIGFGYAQSTEWLFACMALFGIGFGICDSLIPLLIIEYMGVDLLPSTFGVVGFLNALGFVVLGPIIGMIRDLSDDYDFTIQLLSVQLGLAFVSWCFMPLAVDYDKRNDILCK